ncbi:uncharacterized protein Z519_09765 [Cladophialophora bantiana CBS 173.52]|uniref:PRISE-like Rossmann-fold domain-containing protein n=1 Tax=Cladophialophora bantiana (strain ATCC 10958 / CBS 173.52 / CDC B-1940 / NIH 8579) TaxID=1442370 RepID=A0A0D2HYF4_CLAB1|nr:uncharacterized protein Z519_09765 [Cladophialophora bantiana CBS 173.52]KIW89609.1 hypothetical protein Z519_09765 [Cladophialophora bantiana CBS 173.52]
MWKTLSRLKLYKNQRLLCLACQIFLSSPRQRQEPEICKGFLDELLTYPSPTTFKLIIGLTYRRLSKETAMVPKGDYHRVELYSGFDLGLPVDEIVTRLSVVYNVGDVGPVYVTSYTAHGKSHERLIKANVALVSNSIQALEKVCPKYSFFTLQTGEVYALLSLYSSASLSVMRAQTDPASQHYGLKFIEHIKIEIPLKESAPRVPSPWGDKIFYYVQVDEIKRLARGKKWEWCELRPDAIVCRPAPSPSPFPPIDRGSCAPWKSCALGLHVLARKTGACGDVKGPVGIRMKKQG